jgi:transposase
MTKMETANDLGIKRDRLGRVTMSAEKRQELLETFDCSGMSGQQYAAHIGVKYPTFANWRQTRDRQRQSGQHPSGKPKKMVRTKAIQWLEATLENVETKQKGERGLYIELEEGARIEISNREQIELAAELLLTIIQQRRRAC